MNLIDLVDQDGLQQDEWSLTSPTFGEGGHLEVVGHNGGKGNKKYYILKCSKCSQDPELFGEGYFKSVKDNLTKGKLACGCSKIPKWSRDQYFTLCSRQAKELGYKFLGFMDNWDGRSTKIRMSCQIHGEWYSGNISSLINCAAGCPYCKFDILIKASAKPDEVMINSFLASGAFHPDTKFWRSDRKRANGYKPYWFISCPECGETGESMSGHLQIGQRPCACNMHRQQECYINWLIDDHGMTVAIKFGIARDSKQRIKSQDRQSVYTLKQHNVYIFPDVESCKKAERECKKELECGVVLKRDMPDGYTETTYIYNLDKIIQIYKKHGGVKI